MRAGNLSQLHSRRDWLPIMRETELLELFSPSVTKSVPRNEHTNLWRVDAIHRANNLAQMTISLAAIAGAPSRRWLSPELTMQVRRLSRAYEELGVETNGQTLVPCVLMLTEIVCRLINIFGGARQIMVEVSADSVLLPPDVRRALVLIASELVINALKYGYPTQTGGTILVSLVAGRGEVEMIVEDDGIGVVETYRAGQGSGLLNQLGGFLGATLTRSAGRSGHGFRVSALVPLAIAQHRRA